MNFSIRKAVISDAETIYDLIIEQARVHNEIESIEITLQDITRDGFGEHPKFKVLIAEDKDEIAGMLIFYDRYSTWKGKTIHMEDLVIKATKRRMGIGEKLFKAGLQYAHENGYKRVTGDVYDWNIKTIPLYEKLGTELKKNIYQIYWDRNSLSKIFD